MSVPCLYLVTELVLLLWRWKQQQYVRHRVEGGQLPDAKDCIYILPILTFKPRKSPGAPGKN